MRLATCIKEYGGIPVEHDDTFGRLRFSGMRREVQERHSDGTMGEITRRTYDLKSSTQGQMIQVNIPAEIPLKEFDYNAEVELVNPILRAFSEATFMGADAGWYIKADDIILRNASRAPGKPEPSKPEPPKRDDPKEAAQQGQK